MLARNTALNKMGYKRAGNVLEVYKTQAASFGVETTPAPIETIDAGVDPAEITEYPEYRGGDAARNHDFNKECCISMCLPLSHCITLLRDHLQFTSNDLRRLSSSKETSLR